MAKSILPTDATRPAMPSIPTSTSPSPAPRCAPDKMPSSVPPTWWWPTYRCPWPSPTASSPSRKATPAASSCPRMATRTAAASICATADTISPSATSGTSSSWARFTPRAHGASQPPATTANATSTAALSTSVTRTQRRATRACPTFRSKKVSRYSGAIGRTRRPTRSAPCRPASTSPRQVMSATTSQACTIRSHSHSRPAHLRSAGAPLSPAWACR